MRYSTPKLLHSKVYMPKFILSKTLYLEGIISEYDNTLHFFSKYNDKDDIKHYMSKEKMTKALKSIQKNKTKPFEIEVMYDNRKKDYIITKYVVRVSYDDTRDVSFVIVPVLDKYSKKFRGRIKTAWLNDKEDVHSTLNVSKYAKSLNTYKYVCY